MHPEDIVLGLKEWRREEFAANWPLGFAKLVVEAIAALESEEPLAVVKARCYKDDLTLNGLHHDLDACMLHHEGACGPVTVTITERHDA